MIVNDGTTDELSNLQDKCHYYQFTHHIKRTTHFIIIKKLSSQSSRNDANSQLRKDKCHEQMNRASNRNTVFYKKEVIKSSSIGAFRNLFYACRFVELSLGLLHVSSKNKFALTKTRMRGLQDP